MRRASATCDRLLDVMRDAEVGREQVRGPGGNDRDRGVGTGEHVDAALHHAVAAPDDDEVRAGIERGPHALRRLPTLRHLEPERVGHALAREHGA